MMLQVMGYLLPYITIVIGIFVFQSAWLAILSYHAGMVAIILLAKKRIPPVRLFKSLNHKTPAIMAVVGAGGGILLYVFWPFLAAPGDIGAYMGSIGLTEQTLPLFIVYFVLFNALLEEYFWRGLLANDSTGLTMNDLFFSGYHLLVLAGGIEVVWLLVIFLVMAMAGWSWRQVNRCNEGLLPSVACHLAADISVMLTAYLSLN